MQPSPPPTPPSTTDARAALGAMLASATLLMTPYHADAATLSMNDAIVESSEATHPILKSLDQAASRASRARSVKK